jgi:hypothetical protein
MEIATIVRIVAPEERVWPFLGDFTTHRLSAERGGAATRPDYALPARPPQLACAAHERHRRHDDTRRIAKRHMANLKRVAQEGHGGSASCGGATFGAEPNCCI